MGAFDWPPEPDVAGPPPPDPTDPPVPVESEPPAPAEPYDALPPEPEPEGSSEPPEPEVTRVVSELHATASEVIAKVVEQQNRRKKTVEQRPESARWEDLMALHPTPQMTTSSHHLPPGDVRRNRALRRRTSSVLDRPHRRRRFNRS